jgi:hypothetical protein
MNACDGWRGRVPEHGSGGLVAERQEQPRSSMTRRMLMRAAIVPAVGMAGKVQSKASEPMRSPDSNLAYLSTSAQAALIRSGELKSEDLVALYLHRIERFNPKLNAVVALAADARQRAKEADAALAEGRILGPLHGVPMTIKDCFDTAAVVSTWGTLGRKDFVPDADATVVARLKAAARRQPSLPASPRSTSARITAAASACRPIRAARRASSRLAAACRAPVCACRRECSPMPSAMRGRWRERWRIWS